MSDKTGIEWTEATWNPVTGCSKVSQGCKNCYAEREWPRMAANPGTVYFGREFTDVQCHPERLDQPLRWKRPRRIFVNSMSDLFHEAVPDEFIAQVFAVMERATVHTFQVLTKRPKRMMDWVIKQDVMYRSAGYPGGFGGRFKNVWLGVSVEDQDTADQRVPILLETPAAVRWISVEPLLGPVDLRRIQHPDYSLSADTLGGIDGRGERGWTRDIQPGTTLDWVVVGGESGPKARQMHPDWVRSLRNQCSAAGVPFLFKQWGEFMPADADDCDPAAQSEKNLYWSDGSPWTADDGQRGSVELMCRVGKKAAGRTLDGRTWDDYPDKPPL